MSARKRNEAEKAAKLFSLLADPSRLAILDAVAERGGANVQSIAERVGLSQSAASHQLQTLLAAKVVRAKREGRTVTYSLAKSAAGVKVGRLLRF